MYHLKHMHLEGGVKSLPNKLVPLSFINVGIVITWSSRLFLLYNVVLGQFSLEIPPHVAQLAKDEMSEAFCVWNCKYLLRKQNNTQ